MENYNITNILKIRKLEIVISFIWIKDTKKIIYILQLKANVTLN